MKPLHPRVKKPAAALALFLLSVLPAAHAQVFIEASPVGTVPGGAIVVYGMGGSNPKIPYERIKGSPFLDPRWRKASLLQVDGSSLGRHDVRLNLVTHEVHFLDRNGVELAANDRTVSRVVFTDSTPQGLKPVVYRSDYDVVNRYYGAGSRYARELNQGPVSLLKVTVRTCMIGDSLFGTLKRFYFADRIDYFLRVRKRIEKLKKLSEDELHLHLTGLLRNDDWIRRTKAKLSREEDAVRYIDLVNAQLEEMGER